MPHWWSFDCNSRSVFFIVHARKRWVHSSFSQVASLEMLTTTLCFSVDETVTFFLLQQHWFLLLVTSWRTIMSIIDLVDFADQLCYKCLSFWRGNELKNNTNLLSKEVRLLTLQAEKKSKLHCFWHNPNLSYVFEPISTCPVQEGKLIHTKAIFCPMAQLPVAVSHLQLNG